MKKKIYISNFSGLGNRLEALVLAAMIQDHSGHQILLDWPELDSLEVAGTRPGRLPPWERLFSMKLRDFKVLGDTYDASADRHPAPGLWWYEHVMGLFVHAFPDVYFVLGFSGEAQALA